MNAMAAARPCRRPGCGALVRDGSGYCMAHQADKRIGTFADPLRGSAASRGYGAAWAKRRESVMRRDRGLCQPCLLVGRVTPATQVDHILAKGEGGTDDQTNLQAIYTACHKAKTAAESRRGRKGA
jgi:5-methylcytosine-specific restriction protein A